MKISKQEIKRINSTKSARKGKIYSDFSGSTYIGQADGSLLPGTKSQKDKLRDKDIDKRLSSAEDDIDVLETDITLKEYTTDVDAKLKALECKLIAMNIVL
jgi:hypothetical protein